MAKFAYSRLWQIISKIYIYGTVSHKNQINFKNKNFTSKIPICHIFAAKSIVKKYERRRKKTIQKFDRKIDQ